MTAVGADAYFVEVDEQTYKRRIWAWTMYDWANSAFATTILAAVLPAYYSGVAGATLPSEATATAYWSLGLSISLFIGALISPVLGTVSDIVRGKKRFLSIFAGLGVVGTGLLVFVSTGDWLLASLLFVLGRVGFTGSIVFYDALLPHVAREEDHDIVSARGYAIGYLGGGLLLAVNVAMIFFIPDSLFEFAGIRLSFLSVAIWWAVFTIPLLRNIPEPPSATARLAPGENVIGVSIRRLRDTFRDVRQYSELFKFLVAFLIYNDAIGTIIGMAVIYGSELGFGTIELLLALLLVQFVGIPFSLIFGRLPSPKEQRRPFFLAFIIFNLVAMPVIGLGGGQIMPIEISGAEPPPYETLEQDDLTFYGQGVYAASSGALATAGEWQTYVVSGDDLIGEGPLAAITAALAGRPDDVTYFTTDEAGAEITLPFNGRRVEVTYSVGPDHGVWAVLIDGLPLTQEGDDGAPEPVVIDARSEIVRYGLTRSFTLETAGPHVLTLVNSGEGGLMEVAQLRVPAPERENNLFAIVGLLAVVQAVGLVFAYLFKGLFTGLAARMDTQRSILLALVVYSVIAVWGFFVNSTVEFWLLAWMVAIVQGGSQALSRSMYASMSPASKSGEFFGLYGVMEKFSAIMGPLIFAAAVAIFGSSRPAIVSLIAFFIIGGFLLMRVDMAEGVRVAREEDAASLKAAGEA